MPIESILKTISKDIPLGEFNTEGIVMDAVRDLVKDEIKGYLKMKIEEDPALKDELKDAVELFMEAKIRETFAALKLAKAGTKLGLTVVPEQMLDDITKEFSKVFEKELFAILEKSF